MSWSYRLVHRVQDEEEWYAMHEHYPEVGGSGVITQNPVAVHGDTLEDAMWALDRMREAFDKPVLEWADFDKENDE